MALALPGPSAGRPRRWRSSSRRSNPSPCSIPVPSPSAAKTSSRAAASAESRSISTRPSSFTSAASQPRRPRSTRPAGCATSTSRRASRSSRPRSASSTVQRGRRLKEEVARLESELSEARGRASTSRSRRFPNFIHPEVPEGGEDDARELRRVGEPARFDFEARDHLVVAEGHRRNRLRIPERGSPARVVLPEERSRPPRARPPALRARPSCSAAGFTPVHHARRRAPRDRRRARLQPEGPGDPDLLARQRRSLPRRDRGDHARRAAPRRDPERGETCRCAMRASPIATAPKPALTGGRARASTGCTSSPRSRCSSSRPRRPPRPCTTSCSPWRSASSAASSFPIGSSTSRRGDLGAPAYRKFDIEAWMPGRGDEGGSFGEITSDLELHRLPGTQATGTLPPQGRQRGEEDRVPPHLLNGTADLERAHRSSLLLEVHQRADGGSPRSPRPCSPTWVARTPCAPPKT